MFGLWKIVKFLYGMIDPASNALSNAPLEWKYLATNILGFMWCVSFGLYVGEYVFIGYSIIGHLMLITMCFATYHFWKVTRQHFDPDEQA